MKKLFYFILITFILFGCSSQDKKVETIKTTPVFEKYDGKFPTILAMVQNGKKIEISIGVPYKAGFQLCFVNSNFKVGRRMFFDFSMPGIHNIELWQPSGDYLISAFDGELKQTFCCYEHGFEEIKLYKAKDIKTIDNVLFFGEMFKQNSSEKTYIALVVNNIDVEKRIKKAGRKFYKK